MKPRAGSKALIREINEALVLDIVRTQGPVSRAVVAAQTGLSAASVTGITGKLIQARLLVETETVRDTGGRPARLLELGRDGAYAVGVRLSNDGLLAVLVDLRGTVVASHAEPLRSTDPTEAANAVGRAARTVAGGKAKVVAGVGVALSGIVDQYGGVVRHSGALEWSDVPFQAMVEEAAGELVIVDSYVNAYARGLLVDGSFRGRGMLVFSVGTSLGAAVVIDGRIQRGHYGSAGGLAHTKAAAEPGAARRCHCGADDCLETRSSLWGIRREQERLGVSGDVDSALIADAAVHLAVGMANAAKIFGPEHVVVGFAPEARLDKFPERASQAFLAQYAHAYTPAPTVETVIMDHAAVARGAGYSILAGLFTAEEPQKAAASA